MYHLFYLFFFQIRVTTMDLDFIICKLCTKKFTDPCHLECLHDFCRHCIRDDLTKNLSNRLSAYSCPICKQLTSTRNKSPEAWLEQLPQSDFVAALTEVYKLKNDDVICIPCNRKEKTTPGIKWCRTCHETLCSSCLEVHGSLKTTMKHGIMDLSEVKTKETKNTIFDPNCPKHDQPLMSFCEDHDELICSSCTVENHKECRLIKTVNDQVRAKWQQFQEITSKSFNHLQITQNALESTQSSITEGDTVFLNLRNRIQSVRKRVDEILSQCEKNSIEELNRIEKEYREKLQQDMQKLKSLNTESVHTDQLLGNVKEFGTDSHILQSLQQVQFRNTSHSVAVEEYKEVPGPPTVHFVINSQLDEMLKSVSSFGDLIVNENSKKSAGRKSPKLNRDESRVQSPMGNRRTPERIVSVKTRSDENPCLITGILSLPSLDWLFCDNGNSKLKLYNSQFQIKSEHILEETPYDVTSLEDHIVAVTVPRKMKILVFKVSAGINLQEELRTSYRFHGISYSLSGNKFAVTCPIGSPASVRILSRDGKELMNILPDDNLQSLFLRPWYVTFDVTGNSFYVSDSQRSRVTSITRLAHRRFHYTHTNMKAPRGLAQTASGDLFVAGWGSDTVHRIDEEGRFQEEYLTRHDGIISPQALCVSYDKATIALSFDHSSCRSDFVHTFHL